MEAPPAADKWVLVSNLHKTIRLGRVPEAVATAEALYHCDPAYFRHRSASLRNLPDRFDLEFFRISLARHDTSLFAIKYGSKVSTKSGAIHSSLIQ